MGTKLESKLETPKAKERTLGTLGTYSNWVFQETHFYLNSVTDWERLLGTQISNCRNERRTLVMIVALLLPTFLSLRRFFSRYALVLFLFFDLGMLIGNSRYYKPVRPVILRMSTSCCLCLVLPGGRFRCLGVLRLVLPGRRDFETSAAGVALAFLPHT